MSLLTVFCGYDLTVYNIQVVDQFLIGTEAFEMMPYNEKVMMKRSKADSLM